MNTRNLKLTSLISFLVISSIPLTSCNYDFDDVFKYTYTKEYDSYVMENIDLLNVKNYDQIEIPTTFRGKKIKSVKSLGENFKKSSINKIKYTSNDNVINENLFKDFVNLYSVELDTNIKEIGNSAFENCVNLKSINLPKQINKIGDNAFSNTKKACFLRDSCKDVCNLKIGYRAFENSGINNLGTDDNHISSVLYIDNNAFIGSSLSKVYIDYLSSTAEFSFNNTFIDEFKVEECRTYKNGTFYNCSINSDNYYPSFNSKNFNSLAIQGIKGLKYFTYPNDVKKVASLCFKDCVDLEEVTFNINVEEMENDLFTNCLNLKRIFILGDPRIDSGFILPNENCTLYIKKDTKIYNYCVENGLKFKLI